MDDAQAARIAEALETTRRIVKELDDRSRQQQEVLIEIRHDVKSAGETASRLNAMIFTGSGGQSSMMTRMTLVEQGLIRLESSIDRDRAETAKVKIAWIASLVALVGTIITAIVSAMK